MIAISYLVAKDAPAETIHAEDPEEAADIVAQMKQAGCIILSEIGLDADAAEVIGAARHARTL